MARYVWGSIAKGEPTGPTLPPGKGTPKSDQTPTPPATPAPTPAPPVAVPDPNSWDSFAPQYLAGLKTFIGEPTDWYQGRGGIQQAKTDYYNLLNAWSQRAGLPLTPDDWAPLWSSLGAYRTGYQTQNPTRAFTMSDAYRYMNRMLAGAPNPTPVTFLRTGTI
jgi:hypothetical protein